MNNKRYIDMFLSVFVISLVTIVDDLSVRRTDTHFLTLSQFTFVARVLSHMLTTSFGSALL
jgi:hypothetical protein